jgi:hypothetical protein
MIQKCPVSSKEQDFYFGDDFLLRRHDYRVEVAGGFPVAQYVYDIVDVDGLRFPPISVDIIEEVY